MNEVADEIIAEILEISAKGMDEYRIKEGENKGAFLDLINNLLHPRTAAEMALAYLALWKHTKKEGYSKLAEESLKLVLKHQNPDGSWNEYYVDAPCKDVSYWSNVPTGLNTISLCYAYKLLKKEEYRRAAIKAAYFIISTENGKGYFRKGKIQIIDALNTDAICAAALVNVYGICDYMLFLSIAKRGCYHIIKSQHWNGAFPYAYGELDKNINYQTVTTGFLLMANKYIEDCFIQKATMEGYKWLNKNFDDKTGQFKWDVDTVQGKETGNPATLTMFPYIEHSLNGKIMNSKSAIKTMNVLIKKYRGILPRDIRKHNNVPDPYFTAAVITPLSYLLLEDGGDSAKIEKTFLSALLWYHSKFSLPLRLFRGLIKRIESYIGGM